MATVVIAEAGVNHNGDLDTALRLIDAASAAGADIVKFQSFSAEELTTQEAETATYQKVNDGHSKQQAMLRGLQLTTEENIGLSRHCRSKNIQYLSTPFGKPQLKELLEIGISAIKVASGEITHLPLLEAMSEAAKEQKLPIYLSTGMSTLGEIEQALEVFLSSGIPREQVTIMHCVSAYPTPLDEVNLNILHALKIAFGCNIGFSDHTLGTTASISAVTLGATVVEKHLTLDRNMKGPDHQASLEPGEFHQMVNAIREVERLLGSNIKTPQASELNTRTVARRSIRAARNIKEGEILKDSDMVFQRPGNGISPMHYKELLGKKMSISIIKGESLGLIHE